MLEAYPLIEARGTPRELGRQHGEQCRDRLLAFLDYLGSVLKLSAHQLESRAPRFLRLFRQHCPQLVEEVEGLAEGAGVRFEQALAVQIRGELGPIGGGACTTFVIAARGTAAGQILIGQNSDVEPEYEPLGYVLHLKPAGKPALMMWTFGGQIGYHGLNAAGVAHFANALAGGPAWKLGLPHYPVKRMMLEQRTLADVLALVRRAPVCSNGNYVLCDGAGRIADIELTPDGFELIDDRGDGFIVHSNHYLCGAHACQANYDVSLPDSFSRLTRIGKLVAEKFGTISVGDMKRILSDHAEHPTSICRHPHDGPDHPSVSARGKTSASMIAEPAVGRFHVSKGNPCISEYATYQLSTALH